jgi:Zn-dependent membrane protease YugP
MIFLVLAIVIALLVYLPQLWIRLVMRRHSQEIPDMPGTGGELARHLLDRFELNDFSVEETAPFKDHFDPTSKTVRLSPKNYSGKSLTAIAVAAHEVGHALQFHRKEPIFELRRKYIPLALSLKQVGIFLMMVLPVIAVIFKSPAIIFVFVGLSIVLQLLGALSYLILLPEEWDASFNKALPVLEQGQYIHKNHVDPVSSVLKAAALTYFAGALADILNIGRWLLILLRR